MSRYLMWPFPTGFLAGMIVGLWVMYIVINAIK